LVARTKSNQAKTSAAFKTAAQTATRASSRSLKLVLHRPRFLFHATAVGLVLFVMTLGSTSSAHTAKVSMLASQAGQGSVLDNTAAANVAASVADKTSLAVAGEATQTANKLNEQVALPTAGDESLAKRQVVATAGAAARSITTYNVGNGDTLSGIASKFGVTSDTIKWANNLGDVDSLKPGQALTILPMSGLTYTVAAGDTADSLAAKFQANAAQIISFNNAEVKGLVPGQQIIIPDGVKADAPKPAAAAVSAIAAAPSSKFANSASTALTHFAFSGNGYAYGYCTYYVASRRSVPSYWGNASAWYYNAQASGFGVGSTPVPGAIAWSGTGYYGHVAYVESVSGGSVTVSEMNYNGGWNRVSYRTVPASTFRYIY
jgi:surface antigen/DNA uptake protein ComE-like DNA-binding protein